ncbi:MAG: gamma carbonic anhydrase family protein [Pseudomonadota bacterium]
MEIYALDGVSPQIHPTAWVAPGARLIGNVILEERASVWFNAVLRGDNEPIRIGPGSNVQDGCVLHTDPGFPLDVGEDCTMGHNAIIHGCRIGSGALIGMGATVLNGAEIKAGSLVGANALVTEGKSFEPGSLIVGAPAKAVRVLDEQAIQEMRLTAGRYVANAERYRQGLELERIRGVG